MVPNLSGREEKVLCINDLPGDLLEDIFLRLCFSPYAAQCKLVCKHWSGSISRDLIRRIKDNNNTSKGSSLSLVFRMKRSFDNKMEEELLLLYRTHFLFRLDNNSISLPTLQVLYDGILLKPGIYHEFIIRSVQGIRVKRLPLPSFCYLDNVVFGFFCDNSDGGSIYDTRYSVFVIPDSCKDDGEYDALNEHIRHTISSSNNRWCNCVLSVRVACRLDVSSTPYAYRGSLFLLCYTGAICFDPYKNDHHQEDHDRVIDCHFIAWPHRYNSRASCLSIGEVEGHLLISDFDQVEGRLRVWVLKYYEAGEWFLVHCVGTQDLVSIDPCIKESNPLNLGSALLFSPC